MYVAKLDELKTVGNPIYQRHREDQMRGPAAQQLTALCNQYQSLATSDAQQFQHIEQAEKQKVGGAQLCCVR